MDYDIKDILDLITLSENYESARKRKRTRFNVDVSRLKRCVGPLKKLNELVGMEEIKKNVVDQILFYTQGLNTDEMMHMCITGPPGVGKTTVGKILAELYCSLGFLKSNNFKIADRSDLIGGYLGQTAIKTKKVLKDSLDGVLFLDEVYAFGTGKDDGDSYSKECIDTINQFLSEHTENFIMIIAGYHNEVERCFFDTNAGLRRRFPWRYEIKDYTPENLKEIFKYQVQQNDWGFEENFDFGKLDDLFREREYFKNNGGDCLNLMSKSRICHSRRVFGKNKSLKMRLSFQDIKEAFDILKKQQNQNKKDPVPYGMYI
jgi:SpoVK/Ycf46/Vps4 family AAA+-type ATPase